MEFIVIRFKVNYYSCEFYYWFYTIVIDIGFNIN